MAQIHKFIEWVDNNFAVRTVVVGAILYALFSFI